MDVSPVGAGPAGINLARTSPSVPPASPGIKPEHTAAVPATVDNYASVVGKLSESDIGRLIQILDPPRSPQTAAQLDSLLHATVVAASAGDVAQAVNHLGEMMALDASHAVAVVTEPRLDSIRANVEAILNQMASAAKLDAEGRIAEATQRSEAMALKKLADWDAAPETLLEIAACLLQSSGPANYLRAAVLAQAVIDASHWAPANASVSTARPVRSRFLPANDGGVFSALSRGWNAFRKAATPRIRVLWWRAPLLILLLSWLALGVAGGVVALLVRKYQPQSWSASLVNGGFELWAIGFLALVLFGFYMRVRNVRF
jgi:hypothetical protein